VAISALLYAGFALLLVSGSVSLHGAPADSPMRGESYFRSDIAIGRVGLNQAAPRREFD
jgi:hypothetical protein